MKQIRESLGISQYTLAKILGVSRSTIAMDETGARILPDDALLKFIELTKKLGVEGQADVAPSPRLGDILKVEWKKLGQEIKLSSLQRRLRKMTERMEALQQELRTLNIERKVCKLKDHLALEARRVRLILYIDKLDQKMRIGVGLELQKTQATIEVYQSYIDAEEARLRVAEEVNVLANDNHSVSHSHSVSVPPIQEKYSISSHNDSYSAEWVAEVVWWGDG